MTWMLTASGRKVAPGELEPQDIAIEDIAAHLAKICRFTGACRVMWSVAEHSLLVADLLAERSPGNHELQLCGLLHDAPEYVLQDVSTPVKGLLHGYRPLELAAWWAIAERFGLPLRLPEEVKHADLVALATERRDLLPDHPEPWSVLDGISPHPTRTVGLFERHWRETERQFLERFALLVGARARHRGMTMNAPQPLTAITLPQLAAGEILAGLALKDGAPSHWVIVLPAQAESLTWDKALAWAKEQGGELPTRQEGALIYANARKRMQTDDCYWLAEEYAGDSSYAWYQWFSNGEKRTWLKDDKLLAVAVRRSPI